MIERQELHCHNCEQYVQFDLDLSLDGNHVLACPNCGHEHCRVVRRGRITDIRWDSRNDSFPVSNITFSPVSTYASYKCTTSSTSNVFLYQSWMNCVST